MSEANIEGIINCNGKFYIKTKNKINNSNINDFDYYNYNNNNCISYPKLSNNKKTKPLFIDHTQKIKNFIK